MDESNIITDGDLTVTPILTDILLAKAYIRMLEEGLLDTVFYQKTPTITEFMLEYLTQGKIVTLGCFRGSEFCGLGWVMAPVSMDGFTRAETGMCFFRGEKQAVKFGRMMLRSFFTRYSIDVIFGTTPAPNRAALIYARRLGFHMTGPVPGLCSWKNQLSDGWISTMTRKQWVCMKDHTQSQAGVCMECGEVLIKTY